MPETARSKPLEIWFQDEARVGQQGTLTRIRAERGTRPRAPRDTRYIWAVLHQSPDKRGVPLPVKMVSQLTQTWHSQVRSFC